MTTFKRQSQIKFMSFGNIEIIVGVRQLYFCIYFRFKSRVVKGSFALQAEFFVYEIKWDYIYGTMLGRQRRPWLKMHLCSKYWLRQKSWRHLKNHPRFGCILIDYDKYISAWYYCKYQKPKSKFGLISLYTYITQLQTMNTSYGQFRF